MNKTAVLVRDNLSTFNGHAALYRLTPPIEGRESYGTLAPPFGPAPVEHEYVIASAIDDRLAHETYLFPAFPDGSVADWNELPGSLKGTTDHAEALAAAGYEIV